MVSASKISLVRAAQESRVMESVCILGPGQTDNLALLLPREFLQPFNLAEFIGRRWGVAEPEETLDLAKLDFSWVRFETCLKHDEELIEGEEKLMRLRGMRDMGVVCLNSDAFHALWLDYQTRGENSILEWLRKNERVTYLDFFGLILKNPSGARFVLYFYWSGGRWGWRYRWLGHRWDLSHRSAVLGP